MDNFDLSDIYEPDIDVSTITIEHKSTDETKPLCIFGVLKNSNGFDIEKEMLEWLLPEYNVYCVYQNAPGYLFEYPAIRFMQYILEKENKIFALYLHTKGAANSNFSQKCVRNAWKNEFTGDAKNKYIELVKDNKCNVACPYKGNNRATWFNGFYVTQNAILKLGKIIPHNNDRYYFENMFNNAPEVNIIGLVLPTSTAFEVMNHVVRRPLTPYRYNPNIVKHLPTPHTVKYKHAQHRIYKQKIFLHE